MEVNKGQNLFNALKDVCEFTALESDMDSILNAILKDNPHIEEKCPKCGRIDGKHFSCCDSANNQVNGDDLMKELLDSQEEIISSPIRFNGVHIEKIKQAFAKFGIIYTIPF